MPREEACDNLENGDKPFDCTASSHSVSPGGKVH